MTKINYRLLEAHDLDNYRHLRLECLKHHPDNFGTTYEEELNAKALKFDKALIEKHPHDFLFGAFENDLLIGICGFVQQPRVKTKHMGEVIQMYVNASYSGQGIGSRLLKLTVAKAFENPLIDQVLLSVIFSNEKAVTTYKNIGFVQYGKLENYFKQEPNSWTQLFMVLTREVYSALHPGPSH